MGHYSKILYLRILTLIYKENLTQTVLRKVKYALEDFAFSRKRSQNL
jgi:hypothetical protein